MNSIDIDVGGTFTDLVLNFAGKTLLKKVPTTPYDLSVCFSRVIEEGASALGLKMDELNNILREIQAESLRDLLGEAIKPDRISCSLELEIACPGRSTITAAYPDASFHDSQSLRTFCQAKSGVAADKMSIELLRVQIRKAMPKPTLGEKPLAGADSAHAKKGTRNVAWGSSRGQAQVYRWECLQPGNRVEGCAVLEGANCTYLVPEGWNLVVDPLGNANLNRR